jgi:hypothetical protein
MNFLDSICCKVVSNLTDANAKVANPANDGAIEVPAHLGLAELARLALATPKSETAKGGEV